MAQEQVARALDELGGRDVRAAAHAVRKRLKKIRALLRLVRPELGSLYEQENVRFRDVGRLLAPIRDATSLVEAAAALEKHAGQAFDAVSDGLDRRRRSVEEKVLARGDPLAEASAALEIAVTAIDDWSWGSHSNDFPRGLDDFPQGLTETYRRGRKALDRAQDEVTPENLHGWRKRAKYHRYHCRLLEPIWKGPLAARQDEAHDLTDLLGEYHDFSQLEKVLLADPSRFGGFNAVDEFLMRLGRRRAKAAAKAFGLGSKLYAEKHKTLARRLARYWQVAAAPV